MSFVERVSSESLTNWFNWLTEPPAVCCCCSAYAQIIRVAHSWVRSSCCLDEFLSISSTLIISSDTSLSLLASSLNGL